jgi:RNA polymerase sigma-70 factor, ECF subfamily
LNVDFDALYRNHYARVFGLCLRLLGRRPQAEDATQEVFVRAYRSLHQYDTEQPFAAWVLGIASHHCVDLIRRRSREQDLFGAESDDLAELPADAPGTVDRLLETERGDAVRAAVAGLPDKYRLPIVLAYYNDWSYDRIAAELDLTRSHVGVLLLRARHRLRAALAAVEEEPRQ